MRIQNITGDNTWKKVATPVGQDCQVHVQHRGNVAVDVRFANNPAETMTVKAGETWEEYHGRYEAGQFEVRAASGVIEVFITVAGF